MSLSMLPATPDDIHSSRLCRDFHESEVKTLSALKRMSNEGFYRVFLFSECESGKTVGYACLAGEYSENPSGKAHKNSEEKSFEKRFVLLDYFAVEPSVRSKGCGSKMLETLASYANKMDFTLVAEVENPAFAEGDSDLATRNRRIAFYLRNNAAMTRVTSRVTVDNYLVLRLAGEGNENEIVTFMKGLYLRFFGEAALRDVTVNIAND